jgi:uncharacterized protein
LVRIRLLLSSLLVLAAACSTHPPARDYAEDLTGDRAAKDEMFRRAADSPIPGDRADEFLPLAYYPIDEGYRAPAALAPFDASVEPVLEMPTSTGQMRAMQRAGVLQFSMQGQTFQLSAFVSADDPGRRRLFVPFRDLTNGMETYQAGRYLDLDRTATGLYDLDFNRAYQPYCYFDPGYDCPIPPRENRLDVPIRAGERMRADAASHAP